MVVGSGAGPADPSMALVGASSSRRRERDGVGTFRGALIVLVVLVSAFAVWPVLLGGDSRGATAITDLTEAGVAAVAAVVTARRGARTRQPGWYLIAAACTAWFAGQVAWTWTEVLQHRLAPVSSAADIGFVLFIPLAGAGFLHLGFGNGGWVRHERLHRLTEAAVIATSLAFVFWETSLGHVAGEKALSTLDRILLLSYPIGDMAVVTVALVAVLNRRSRALELAALGAIAITVADGVYSYHQSTASFRTGSSSDLLWVIGLSLLVLAGLWPEATYATASRRAFGGRSVLGSAPTLAALGVGAWRLVLGGTAYDGTRSVMIAAIGSAVLVNQLTSYAENSALHRSLRHRVDDLAKSEERFRLVVDDLAEGVLIVDGDAVIVFASRRIGRMLGVAPAELVGRRAAELVHPDDESKALHAFATVLRREDSWRTLTVRVRRRDGTQMWVECDAANLLDDAAVSGVVISVRDVTERLESEAALTEARERFRAAFEHAPIGMALAAVNGTLLEVNGSFARMLGYRPDELAGRNSADLTHPDDWALSRQDFGSIDRDADGTYRLEKRYIRADGRTMWASVSFSFLDRVDGSQLVIGQVEDVTQRKAIAERLEYSARHDELTGLSNRSSFMDRLERALNRIGDVERVAVMLLDLDRFKVVNDSLGHAAGDDLLRVIAHRLQRFARPTDTVARFGGDEFTVLVVDAPSDAEVAAMADRFRRAVAEAVPLTDGDTYVSTSIGIAIADRAGLSGESLVQDADAAMYRAKERGRNRVERFDATARASVVRRLRTGNDLHRALQRSEFRVEYQPVVNLAAGRVIGFEALARWAHPDRGLITPSDFIDLAEETGLIVPIGSAIMEQAFEQVARWRARRRPAAAAELHVSVNLSARQLGTPGLVAAVAAAIEATGIEPDCVWLEITESALMTDAKAASVALRALRGIGVHLTVDDFGTGYSSLTYLQRFPVEGLKIDRSFVDGLGIDTSDTTIVDTLVRLGHSLGLTVVAEGLETSLQLQHLRRLGCDNAQGFLFSKPMPAETLDLELHRWLEVPLPAVS